MYNNTYSSNYTENRNSTNTLSESLYTIPGSCSLCHLTVRHQLLREPQRVGRTDQNRVLEVNLARAHLSHQPVERRHPRQPDRDAARRRASVASRLCGAARGVSLWVDPAVAHAAALQWRTD